MTTKELQSQLNTLIVNMDRKNLLFYGGCCYAAAQIAKRLESIGVPYNVVLYHDFDKRYMNQVADMCLGKNKMINHPFYGIDHVAIAIKFPKKRYGTFEIGGKYYEDLGGSKLYKRVVLEGITSTNLKWMCKHGEWNHIYDHRHDTTLRRKLNLIFKQYKNEII